MTPSTLDGYDGPRTPRPEEWDTCLNMARSIFFSDAADYMEAARRWPMAMHADLRETSFAMFRDGHPVSMIARLERDFVANGCLLRMGFVGGVCTHPDHRGRGLAGTTLAATLDVFHKHGVDFAFISGARPLYFGAGANHTGGLIELALGRETMAAFADAAVSVREAAPEDAALMARLNQQEGLHFVRRYDDYRFTLEQAHCSGKASASYIVEANGAPGGYVITTKPWGKDGQVGMSLVECAGAPSIVMAALAPILAEAGENATLHARFPSAGSWARVLHAWGLHGVPVAHSGTIKAVDFARIVAKLQPCFVERLPQDAAASLRWTQGRARYAGSCNGGVLAIDGETNMLWTLLGAPPEKTAEPLVATGPMRTLLDECLPLPLPSVDMNKI